MSKILNDKELLEIVSDTINKDAIDDMDTYMMFLEDMANIVAKYFGGSVGMVDFDESTGEYWVPFHITEEVPENGGVFSKYDTDVEWFEGKEKEKI